MKSVVQIRARLAECKGMIQTINNRSALDFELSSEEYEVMDSLVGERDALEWVIK
jgi:hypothetical protein